MSGDHAVFLLSRLLWTAFLVSAPVLISTLAVGLAISVIQAITQLQESTLSYVPKLVVAGVVLAIGAPWMMSRLTSYAINLYAGIATIG
jgi:flagellar biosynthesis protein FliQ